MLQVFRKIVVSMIFVSGLIVWSGAHASILSPEARAIIMVAKGIEAYDQQSTAVFNEINKPDSAFRDGGLYLFVIRADDGYHIASAGHPETVGPVQAMTPVNREVVIDVIAKATPDGTWVEYEYNNPETGRFEAKRSWIILVDGYVFGAGIYE